MWLYDKSSWASVQPLHGSILERELKLGSAPSPTDGPSPPVPVLRGAFGRSEGLNPSLRDAEGSAIPGVSSLGSDHQSGKAKLIGNINLHVAWGKQRGKKEMNMPTRLPVDSQLTSLSGHRWLKWFIFLKIPVPSAPLSFCCLRLPCLMF